MTTRPPARSTTYNYDPLGNLTEMIDHLGNRTTYQYDARQRLAKIIEEGPTGSAGRPETVFAYNNVGQVTGITDPLGNLTSYQYNDLGQLTTLTLPDPDPQVSGDQPWIHYFYLNSIAAARCLPLFGCCLSLMAASLNSIGAWAAGRSTLRHYSWSMGVAPGGGVPPPERM